MGSAAFNVGHASEMLKLSHRLESLSHAAR